MAIFKKKVGQRRREVRRNIASATPRWGRWKRFAQAGGPAALLIAVLLWLAASALSLFPTQNRAYRAGEQLPRRYARVSFQAANEEGTRQERERAASQTPATLVVNTNLLQDIRRTLTSLPEQLDGVDQPDKAPAEVAGQFGIESQEDLNAIQQAVADEDAWRQSIDRLAAEVGRIVAITPRDFEDDSHRAAAAFNLITPDGRRSVMKMGFPPQVMLLQKDYFDLLSSRLARAAEEMPAPVRPHVRRFLETLVITNSRPTYRLDKDRTAQDVQEAQRAVPQQYETYPVDSVIFPGGEVAASDLRVLEAEQAAYRASLSNAASATYDPHYAVRAALGRIGRIGLVVILLSAYIAHYQPRVVQNYWRAIALASLMILLLGVTRMMVTIAGWNPYLALGAAGMAAVIITIAYDQRFSLVVSTLLALLVTMQQGMGIGFLLTLMMIITICVFLLKEIRTRSKLIEVGALGAAGGALCIIIVRLAESHRLGHMVLADAGWGAFAVLAVGFVIQGILPLIERVFGIATSMTLLEWCDANKKLFKRLAIEAPGTYNHSLLLGTLCEAAAEAIGARGLLARVGAYYHDIGKTNKPEYFVENQLGSPSKHVKLSPAMSLLIITGHVKDGLELAREYGLPPVLHEFIASHHGTTLVQYFYHAAAEQRKANGTDRVPDEVEFRYPGPKPRSKEVAILMLADASESSVRAMQEPTAGRIETQVHTIVNQRLMDGQLDECDLTLREVHEIEKSLVKSLCGIYHGRIAYPKAKPKEEAEARPAGA